MLVLARFKDEVIDIFVPPHSGHLRLSLTVVEMKPTWGKGPVVRLGFEAPDEVTILRRELLERTEAEGSGG